MINVKEMMTHHPHTLFSDHTLHDALRMMNRHDIHHIPVINHDENLLGIITHRDVLAAQQSSLIDDQHRHTITLENTLDKVMHTQVMTVDTHASLQACALYMQKHKVGCLPVIEKQRLIGIITNSDFVTIAINLLELQAEAEPDILETATLD